MQANEISSGTFAQFKEKKFKKYLPLLCICGCPTCSLPWHVFWILLEMSSLHLDRLVIQKSQKRYIVNSHERRKNTMNRVTIEMARVSDLKESFDLTFVTNFPKS